ncbi:MAG: hypothetical protein MHPSP_002991, partial [Paramarteilia canceri]
GVVNILTDLSNQLSISKKSKNKIQQYTEEKAKYLKKEYSIQLSKFKEKSITLNIDLKLQPLHFKIPLGTETEFVTISHNGASVETVDDSYEPRYNKINISLSSLQFKSEGIFKLRNM